ncbi:MAG: cation:proton antiporter [Aquificaceae bacterium]|nr:cation:proton antiporter [Aquificaceae bacterium]
MHSSQDFILAGGVFLLLFFSAYLLSKLKVPYILSFILAGLLGKFIFPEKIQEAFIIFEHLAVVLLFFFIGLEYSFERLIGMKKLLKPGIIDFLFNFLPAFGLSYLFTQNFLFSLAVGAIVYPSSTAITAKLLMDYKRLVNPEAEFLIGVLIFEDLISIILLSLLTGFTLKGSPDTLSLLRVILAIILLFSMFYLLRGLAEKFFEYMEKRVEEELVPFFVLGFLLVSSGISLSFGLSDALIAFMLGVIVPENSRVFGIIEKSLSELKDLSVGVFFFMFTFNSKLSFDFNPWFFIIIVFLSIITKFLSTYWGAHLYDIGNRAALRASLSFLQRGEFSVIFASFYEPAQSMAFLLVLITTLLGSFSFILAPDISLRVFPRKEKKVPPLVPPS